MPSRRTLLLADDSPTVQKVVSLTFADEGLEVLTASGGEEALAKLGEVVPDVLLADVHMPSPNGYELCARVKRDPRTAGVPVLLLVGTFEEPLNEAEARACGADGVLTKPFQSIRELVSKVGGLISGHSEQSKAAVAGRDEREAPAPASNAATGAREPSPAAEEMQPHPAFVGFDADDESIESVSADDFVAAGRARTEDAAAEFVTADAPFARASSGDAFAQRADSAERRAAGGVEGRAAGTVEQVKPVEVVAEASPFAAEESSFVAEASPAASVAEASVFGAAAGGRGPRGYAAARFNAPQAEAGFAARAPQPAADDSLLELGELTSPRAHAAADVDDLILDIEDESSDSVELFDSAGAPGATESREAADVFGAVNVEAETFAEPAETSAEPAAGISPANLSSAWSDVPPVEATPAPSVFAAPAPESASETVEPELEIEPEAAHVAESPAAHVAESPASVEAEAVETQDAPAVAASAATLAEVAEPQATRSEAAGSRADEAVGASQLSPEMVETIARRVVELMSDRAVREIAWEVVPDLAERLIRERLEQESTRRGESVKR